MTPNPTHTSQEAGEEIMHSKGKKILYFNCACFQRCVSQIHFKMSVLFAIL